MAEEWGKSHLHGWEVTVHTVHIGRRGEGRGEGGRSAGGGRKRGGELDQLQQTPWVENASLRVL